MATKKGEIMKTHLLYPAQDFDLEQKATWNQAMLERDLELSTLTEAMAAGDEFILDVIRKVLHSSWKNDVETVLFRQAVLRDVIANEAVARELYTTAIAAIAKEREHWWFGLNRDPSAVLNSATGLLADLVTALRKVREITQKHASSFRSDGFLTFFSAAKSELSEEYLNEIARHLKDLRFSRGMLLSARLGSDNESTGFVLRREPEDERGWFERIFSHSPPEFTFHLHPRDEGGARILSELKDRGTNEIANAVAQSSDHVLSFFHSLRTELAFYLGCVNLHAHFREIGVEPCFPQPLASDEMNHSANNLIDACLALRMKKKIVGNELEAKGKHLIVVTGANQGGKSSFLRSIGVAQIMMQSGCFVAADSFSANLRTNAATHYKKEEDPSMTRGKLDEELSRLNDIATHLTPGSLVLFNESFGSTNEREGSEIARQVTSAFLDKGIKVFFVTHLTEFARGLFETSQDEVTFLRAERKPDGSRTFKLIPGEPLLTSYGEDLYQEIFLKNESSPSRGKLHA
jgi:hypothetical protein